MHRRVYLAAALLGLVIVGLSHFVRAQVVQLPSIENVKSTIIANNTTPIAISNVGAVLTMVDAFSSNTTLVFVKLYNATAANTTCGSGTPQWRGMIPFGAASAGGGFALPITGGDAYSNGIAMCVTTGIADSDTGAPAASAYIVNVHFKPFQ